MTDCTDCEECPLMVEHIKKNGGFNLPVMSFIFTVLITLTGVSYNQGVTAAEMKKDIQSVQDKITDQEKRYEQRHQENKQAQERLTDSITTLTKTINDTNIKFANLAGKLDKFVSVR